MINKGDTVLVKSQTLSHRKSRTDRTLWTIPYLKPKKGLIVGYSFLRTGHVIPGDMYDYEPGYLEDIIDHKVWVVELFEKGNRYLKPIKALEENIEVVQ